MDREQAAQQVEERMRVGPGHPHRACDVGEFVENLYGDRAAGSDNRLGAIGLRGIARGDIDEDIGVEEGSPLTGIRLVPVELEIVGKSAAEGAKTLQ
jgi:hypothetical protein